MDIVLPALAAWVIALAINVVPAFMPPTWAMLAVFHASTDVPLLVLTVGGAFFSAVGRVVLAVGAQLLRGVLPESDVQNATALGEFVNRHRAWRFAIVFLYCLGPFPSNPIFIAAGIGRIPLLPVTAAFFLSRVIADTFWVWTASAVSRNASGLFVDSFTSSGSIALQGAALCAVVLFLRLPWARWFGLVEPPNGAASPVGVER